MKLHLTSLVMTEYVVESLFHIGTLLNIETTISFVIGCDLLQFF